VPQHQRLSEVRRGQRALPVELRRGSQRQPPVMNRCIRHGDILAHGNTPPD
jgi:hypothetical protein